MTNGDDRLKSAPLPKQRAVMTRPHRLFGRRLHDAVWLVDHYTDVADGVMPSPKPSGSA
jgi:hypothetical protein